jgi:hypothetical protein
MRTIIAGSRSCKDYDAVLEAIEDSAFSISTVVSGTAAGVDSLGERYAEENAIPVDKFVPDWDRYGKRAGILRNRQMAEHADALIAIWDGSSKGTLNMINTAKALNLKVYVKIV